MAIDRLIAANCVCCGGAGSGSGCAIPGWAGPGWYCIRDGSDCIAVELLAEDECDDAIVICSGPYATELEAILACENTGVSVTCSTEDVGLRDLEVFKYLKLKITDDTGGGWAGLAPCLIGAEVLIQYGGGTTWRTDGPSPFFKVPVPGCPNNAEIGVVFTCTINGWQVAFDYYENGSGVFSSQAGLISISGNGTDAVTLTLASAFDGTLTKP